MSSYVDLLVPLAMLLAAFVVGGWLARKGEIPQSGWVPFAVLACLVVGVAIAVTGWPPDLVAAENTAEQASQQGELPRSVADAAEPVSAPSEAAPTPEQDEGASEAEEADAEAQVERIESWTARTLFNFLLLAVFLAVLIGPFYLGHRITRDWRQPLWAWPVGLVFFCGAVAAAVILLRWVLAPLPDVFGSTLERYLGVLVSLRKLWITVGLVAVPIWLGNYLSRKWRMPDHAARIGIVSFALLAGTVVAVLGWPPKLGIDLSGGVILVYKLQDQPGVGPRGAGDQGQEKEGEEGEDEAARPMDVDMDKLIQAIRLRVDPGSVRELTIRPYGEGQIEVIIPEADEEDLARIKKKISSAGTLEFRILANGRDHEELINDAQQLEGRELKDSEGKLLAWWVPVARGEEDGFLRFSESAETVYRKRTYRGYQWTEFLVVKDVFDVNGGYLVSARTGIDQSGRPSVLFTFSQKGGSLFGALTGNNLPNEADGFSRHLGIILDGYLQSAPSIRSTIFRRGEITGDFTTKEVQDLVDILNAGSLPTALSEQPVSEDFMGPGLGQDTIDRGKIAIGVSMGLVLLFMVFYYRFAGIVACMALVMNLVLILAVMITIRAAFTLPGLAGLVLTVGMAVDANVLIFERIREELGRQATLRMAIRNGFGRATTTIVDANLTTLIVATVLYVIGTDQIKGFAVILWLGVVLSMFTAIYCSRLVFDVAEKQKWITRLSMMRMLGKTQIDFLGKRRLAVGASIVVIVIGLAAVVGRGSGLLDIDFTGGVKIRMIFNQGQRIADIRTKLSEEGEGLQDLAVMNVPKLGEEGADREFIINTSGLRNMRPGIQPDEILTEVKEHLHSAFGEDLVHYSMTVTMLPSDADAPEASEDETASSNGNAEAPSEEPQRTHAKLEFEHKVTHESLKEMFDQQIKRQLAAGLLEQGTVDFTLSNDQYLNEDSEAPYGVWEVKLELPPDKGEALLLAIEKELESEPFFPSSNTIGGQVAGKTRVDAVMALLASLLFIVGYIWIRFQRVMFGLAAVLALVHDVLITLGMIALTAYVAPFMGFLLIDEFKIGLPVLAAFLTIIGYSLNDTIVVFDRIREVRGKAPQLSEAMINTSINQTLSRTLLTSLTTLLVVVVLYVGGGQGIHVFAFALVVGVLVGTYSSIFVASPVLLWMASAHRPARKGRASSRAV